VHSGLGTSKSGADNAIVMSLAILTLAEYLVNTSKAKYAGRKLTLFTFNLQHFVIEKID